MDTPRDTKEASTPREKEYIRPDTDRIASEAGYEPSERQGFGVRRRFASPKGRTHRTGCLGCGGTAIMMLVAAAAMFITLL